MPRTCREKGARQERMRGALMGVLMVGAGIYWLQQPDLAWSFELASRLVSRFWPVFLIVLGLPNLVLPKNDGDQAWGLFLSGAGAALLLQKLGIVPGSFAHAWPLLLVLVGALLLLKSLRAGNAAAGEPR